MTRPRARPRFSFELPLRADDVSARVRAALSEKKEHVEGSVHPRTITLWVTPGQQHFWSPHLDAQLTELAEGRTRVDGVFAPHPQIWTAFIGVQMVFVLLSIGAGVFLISQLTLDGNVMLAALTLLAMLVGGGLSYGAAYIGQGIGSEQMDELRSFLDAALREP